MNYFEIFCNCEILMHTLKNGVRNLSGKQILFQAVKLRHYFCFGKLFDAKFEFM